MIDVIIVGAGVGGLATGMRLASKGYRVSIYEKNEFTGGRVNRLQDNGFTFDSTSSRAIMPNDYTELFEFVGLDIEDYLDITKPNYTYKLFNTEGRELTLFNDLSMLSKELELKSDMSIEEFMKFINDGYDKFKITSEYFLNNPMTEFKDFFNVKNLENIIEINPFSTCYKELSKYINDELVLNALAYQTMYIGLSPYDASSVYTLIPASTQVDGILYFGGGMYSYVEAMTKAFKDLGGKIYLKAEVDKVIIEEGKACGIAVNGRIINADKVIVNTDYSYSVNNLIDFDREKYLDISELEYTCSVFMLYLGLDMRFDKLLLHNIIIQPDFEENVNCIFNGMLPSEPPIYIYNPTIMEEVKSNYQTLNCMIRVPNLKELDIEWNEEIIKSVEDRILRALSKIPGLERLKEHIVFMENLTPRDLENKYNSPHGSAFGISPYLDATNIFRPGIKDEDIENLMYVGDSIHPGSGISIILKGSKLVYDNLLENE